MLPADRRSADTAAEDGKLQIVSFVGVLLKGTRRETTTKDELEESLRRERLHERGVVRRLVYAVTLCARRNGINNKFEIARLQARALKAERSTKIGEAGSAGFVRDDVAAALARGKSAEGARVMSRLECPSSICHITRASCAIRNAHV